MMLAPELRSVSARGMKWQIVLLSESAYESFVFFGLGTANLVIEVSDEENNAQLTSRFQQQTEQRDRIRPARNCYSDAITRADQLTFCCELEQSL
jgi:hypothetical protein